MKATVRELRASTRAILSAVRRGDTVLVTSRGKPCAKIVPVFERKKKHEHDLLFGIWRDKAEAKSVKKYINRIRDVRHAR